MARKEVAFSLPSVTEFLGWHGSFILVTIVIFRLLFSPLTEGCPCTGHVAYGAIMLGLPALCIYFVAFFSYFCQADTQSPWKQLKAYYEMKRPCSYSPRTRSFELHSGVFHQCIECQRVWRQIKTSLCFVLSWVYPLLWLSLGFNQVYFYTCARVGPNPDVINSCDNWKNRANDYKKTFQLAAIKSTVIGNVLFVVVIVLASCVLITYRALLTKIRHTADPEPDDDRERVENFGYDDEAHSIPERVASAQSPSGPRSGTSPSGESFASKNSYQGFRERSSDSSRPTRTSRENEPLIQVEG